MKRTWILTFAVALLGTIAVAESARAFERTLYGAIAHRRSLMQPWHGSYDHTGWGAPVALVVPPTAERQTNWGWGVGSTRVTPIYHQFELGYPGPGSYNRAAFRPTPQWPSDTTQFGVYYVRGPW